MRVIGLTGTIGAGKSTVARWLAGEGASAVDADALVHELYAGDRALQEQLGRRFGPQVLSGGQVDRQALRTAVAEPGALADLEAIVHPAVHRLRDQKEAAARAAGAPAFVYEAIRLVESGSSAGCDELWIVVAAEQVQLARLAARGVPEPDARRWLAVQGSLAAWVEAFMRESAGQGRARPVIVLDNSGSIEQGKAQALRLWRGAASG